MNHRKVHLEVTDVETTLSDQLLRESVEEPEKVPEQSQVRLKSEKQLRREMRRQRAQ